MAAKHLVFGILPAILLCGVAECSTPDQRPAMLSHEAFARAQASLGQTGRPLERALFAFYFEQGSRDKVIAELAKFQNADGGFASCLESDTRWCGSSPLGVMKALGILRDLSVPASDPHVRMAVRYLLATFDEQQVMWHALPREANAAPHASWWEVRANTGKCDVESLLFPTAAIAGYLQSYSTLLPPGFLERITASSLSRLAAAPLRMPMPDIESVIGLVRSLRPEQSTGAVRKLKSVLAATVVQDPTQWDEYNVKPLTFVHSPQSPFYPEMKEAISANLDYIISTQRADGGWGLTWSWADVNPTAWNVAEKEWLGVVLLENLRTLQAFHCIGQ